MKIKRYFLFLLLFSVSFQGYSETPELTSYSISVCIGGSNPSFYVTNSSSLGGLVWYYLDTTNVVQTGGDSYTPIDTLEGTYAYFVKDPSDNQSRKDLVFEVIKLPKPIVVIDNSLACSQGTATITVTNDVIFTSLYTMPGSHRGKTIDVDITGDFMVTGKNNGCEEKSRVFVSVDCDVSLFYPNAFQPGCFPCNDRCVFKMYANPSGLAHFHLLIYNRWGDKMTEITDIGVPWDGTSNGKDCQSGVYVWYVEYRGSISSVLRKETGTVALIR